MSATVLVVCTDRGRHRQRKFDTLSDERDSGRGFQYTVVVQAGAPARHNRLKSVDKMFRQDRHFNQFNHSFRWVCPSCRRDVPLSDERLGWVVDRLRQHFPSVQPLPLDISMLE